MDYMTLKEASEKWGVTTRWINYLCTAGRIPGAVKMGTVWLIPKGFTFHSTMFKYMDSTEVTGGEILGGKTGYTEEAGLCLASLAQVNGKEYILVTAKANGTHQTEQFHILDAINVYSQIGEAGQNTYE